MANINNNNRRKKKRPARATDKRSEAVGARKVYRKKGAAKPVKPEPRDDGKIRLNRFVAGCGVCSRRDADVLITAGAITVNGAPVNELGVRIDPNKDVILYDGATLRMNTLRYVLLNKPKNYSANMDNPGSKRSVFRLLTGACKEPIIPVGKLDLMSVGLLLLTNDEDMIRNITNPAGTITQLYHATTAEKIKATHVETMLAGVRVGDAMVKATKIAQVGDDPRQVGIEMKGGKNRQVRILFEHFGYNIVKLDRVKIGGLTKKDMPRGHFRHLTEDEVNFLRMVR